MRVPLYTRLPEIYRIRDAEQVPAYPLRAYLGSVEAAYGAIHESIESLYHDFFVETCDDWVIPYLADLVGASHLKGESRTLRADVADTIALRRRKGTLAVIERLAANLTGWPARGVELRERLAWQQHLNHQRPDRDTNINLNLPAPPFAPPPRGGTVPIRDPALLTLLGTPFDPFYHTADVKPALAGNLHYNLPNLAIFLWRLEAYRIPFSRPVFKGAREILSLSGSEARYVVGFDLHPLENAPSPGGAGYPDDLQHRGRPVRLFNTYRHDPNAQPPTLVELDACPNPMPRARLNSDGPVLAGNPAAYIAVDTYDAVNFDLGDLDSADVGLNLFLPQNPFAGQAWKFRGENLCAWEEGLKRRLEAFEIAVDPVIGRVLFGVASAAQRNALEQNLLVSFAYGAVGEVGAHPVDRSPRPTEIHGEAVEVLEITALSGPNALANTLANLHTRTSPLVVEIQDSLIHDIDLATISGVATDNGERTFRLARSLVIRASDGHRPIVRLRQPLRFRPAVVVGANATEQAAIDAATANLTVRLEGIFFTRHTELAAAEPLLARAAVGRLEIISCTLDPGGWQKRNGTRAPLMPALHLDEHYGFVANSPEEIAFAPTPDVDIQRSITGALRLDNAYQVFLTESIVDAGAAPDAEGSTAFALAALTAPGLAWAPITDVRGVTFLGRVRVEAISGDGTLFCQQFEVHDNQHGCLKFCWFSAKADRLLPHHACVDADDAVLVFTSTFFEQPGYGQFAAQADWRIRQRGPGDDAMGAYGFLREAHKHTNLSIRLREFMPVGVRPLLIPVT